MCAEPSDERVGSETQRWVEEWVIGLNLCPFAAQAELKVHVCSSLRRRRTVQKSREVIQTRSKATEFTISTRRREAKVEYPIPSLHLAPCALQEEEAAEGASHGPSCAWRSAGVMPLPFVRFPRRSLHADDVRDAVLAAAVDIAGTVEKSAWTSTVRTASEDPGGCATALGEKSVCAMRFPGTLPQTVCIV